MAIINGTQIADTIAGTNLDDVIYGFAGADTINGAAGNDTIDGGAGIDDILGGDGNDTIIALSDTDILSDKIDGGAGIDTLAVDVLAGAKLETGSSAVTDNRLSTGGSTFTTNNIEFVKVTNASNFLLDLGSDGTFGLDAVGAYTASAVTVGLNILDYATTGGVVTANQTANEDLGVIVDGKTYLNGDTFVASDGGTVAVNFTTVTTVAGVNFGTFDFTYTPEATDLYAVGNAAVATDDIAADSIVATVTLQNGTTVEVTADFAINLSATFTAAAAKAGIVATGDAQDNTMTGSNFADVIWAGSTSGDSDDSLFGLDGNDLLGAGDGADQISGGAGNDTMYAGAGNDGLGAGVLGGAGNDTIFGGAGNDTINGDISGDGTTADGDDIIYGGADAGTDTIFGNGGNDTMFGGGGIDKLYGGIGNDTIYNGAGDDAVVQGGAGDDVMWGGAGNDTLKGDAGNDTFGFIKGNGNDTIVDFDFGTTTAGSLGDVLDLTAFGFANTQAVLDSMSDVGGFAVLALAPGQTITFNVAEAAFQAAADDWVLV
jgi:Ca2+-binding RTX toxin-like protein